MSPFWSRLFRRKNDGTLNLFRELYGGGAFVRSGKVVNWKTALEVSTVLACARVIAEGIAQVPLKLFREAPDGQSRMLAKDHPVYPVLHSSPNPWQTSFEYRETLALHAVLTGAHFSFKVMGTGGRVSELWPFEPQQICVKRAADGTMTYEYTSPTGEQKVFPSEMIWHVRGPSWSSWQGMNAVQLAREAIGLAIATEETHASLHRNGTRTGGLLSVEGTMTPTQHEQLRTWLEKNYEGAENAHKTMIMDRSSKFTPLSPTGVDAQHLETRRYQAEEICRALRVMPIMVGIESKNSTYASAEQMFLAHVVHTLSPWYERIEQSINENLLTEEDEKAGIYAKFVEEGLLRGALKDTADYLVKLTTNGILTRNEARSKLDMNPIDGLDTPLTPINLQGGTSEPTVVDPGVNQDAGNQTPLERKLELTSQRTRHAA